MNQNQHLPPCMYSVTYFIWLFYVFFLDIGFLDFYDFRPNFLVFDACLYLHVT